MAGQLQRHPLTELLREISAAELSGALRLTRERARTVIYFDAGEIIYATSNLRAYRLSEAMRRWNVLNEHLLAAAQEKTSDLEFGAALIETGALNREKLDALMSRQVSELLCHMLLWTEGDWEFDPRARLAEDVRVKITPEKLLIESARRLPAEFIAKRFANKSEKLFPESQATDELNLLPTEAFVLTRVDAALSINELLTVGGLPEDETLHIVYTLALGGFLRRESWPQALSAEEIARARSVKASQPQQAEATKPVEVEAKSDPKSSPVTQQVVNQAVSAAEEQYDEQSEIDALFAMIRKTTDHYQMLGVRRSANTGDIKRAYYALAKRFHPDRFRRGADAAQLLRIESAFAQIAQSYEILKNTATRAAYDSKLLKQEQDERANRAAEAAKQAEINFQAGARAASIKASTPANMPQATPTAQQAEQSFQQGFSALQQGNRAAAIALLGEAARLAPNEPRYRAHFGHAMTSEQRLRRSAEAELKAAITLDANNAAYRVMLAELYNEIGLIRRAQGELDRALSIEPQNDAARRLRDKLKGKS
jgi:tetratricopeptide (TPR) repeat protein